MADVDSIFEASGEACPICQALDGMPVPAGFTAHESCLCQTVMAANDPHCLWDWEQVGNARDGAGPFDVVSGVEVRVTCPDGTQTGETIQFDGHGYTDFDQWVDDIQKAAEDAARELCDDCPEKPPFPCV